MRKKTNTTTPNLFFLISTLLLLFTLVLPIQTTTANQGNQLIILLFESDSSSWEPLDQDVVMQGKTYDIVVRNADELTPAYNVTITITALKAVFVTTNEMPGVSFTAPSFDQHNEFIIRASKQGYESSEKHVAVSKGELTITFDRETVEEKGSFCITVTDQNNAQISEAFVFITGHDELSDTTDTNGKAYIKAPAVSEDSDISITVVKSGYHSKTKNMRVIHTQNTVVHTILSTIINVLPILIAFILVLLSMIIVKIRKKGYVMPISKKEKIFSKEPTSTIPLKNQAKQLNNPSYVYQPCPKNVSKPALTSKGSHVEIIRIRNNEGKQKEIKQVIEPKKQRKEDQQKKIPSKNSEYEWFNGTEYMKYKINKITGEENQSCVDRWFVGEDMFQFKLDKKVIDTKHKKKKKLKTA